MKKENLESKSVPESIAKTNLAYTLGYTNLGFALKDLESVATSQTSFSHGVIQKTPYDSECDLTEELRAWLKPSYFKEIKLPMPKLKIYVKKTWDDIFDFMEKYKLW